MESFHARSINSSCVRTEYAAVWPAQNVRTSRTAILQNDRRKQFAHNADFPQSLTLAFLIWNSSRRVSDRTCVCGIHLVRERRLIQGYPPAPWSCGMRGLRRTSCKIFGFHTQNIPDKGL